MRHEITFYWEDQDGFCEGCGFPAAFYSVNAFGTGKHMKLCAVCAANEACDGATLARISEIA